MATKKEKLKLYRIYTNPTSSISDSDKPVLRGYINPYVEFSKYDDDPLSFNVWPSISPRAFFNMDPEQYKNLSFLISDINDPYNRTNPEHDLDKWRARIYIVSYGNRIITGVPFIGATSAPQRVEGQSRTNEEPVLTFYVNPTHLAITKRKLYQQIRTRAGWEFQHWGPQIGELRIDGVTGNITPPTRITMGKIFGLPIIPQTVEDAPTDSNSAALKAFRQLERWYDEDQDDQSQFEGRLLALEYRGRMYVGNISEFTYEERAEHPFMLFYNLTFLIHYESTSFINASDRATKKVIRNLETLRYINSLRSTPSLTDKTNLPDTSVPSSSSVRGF